MTKERIYLTDITLHTRGFRKTVNFSKVAEKGRMYSPMPKDYRRNIDNSNSGGFEIPLEFPTDLQARIDRGEVELMIPEGGLLIFAGQDTIELAAKMKEKERTKLIHNNRGRIWIKE